MTCRQTTALLITILLLAAVSVRAQQAADFTFSHLGPDEGLSSQRIYTVLQTSDGAVWWTTKNDIERYNGVSIKHYQPGDEHLYSDFAGMFVKLCTHTAPGGKPLSPDSLYAFDNKGRVYIYDSVHDRFRLTADVSKMLQDNTDVNDILPAPEGLWMATTKGICLLRDGKLATVRAAVHANGIVPTPHSLLFCTRQGVLALAAHASPLTTKLSTLTTHDTESGYYDALYNKVWLGGYSSGIRVLCYDAGGKLACCDSIVSGVGAIRNPIRSFCPYDDQTLLIGIDGLGVFKTDRTATPGSTPVAQPLFTANEGADGVLHGNGIYALCRDLWGNIFVGSYSGGIDIARPVGTTIAIYKHTPGYQQSVLNDRVNCVEQWDANTLLMGTDNGVSIHNRLTNTWRHTCLGAVVLDLLKTPKGTILAATYGKGVLEIMPDGTCRPIYTRANGALDDDHVYRLFTDRDGCLWMGCLDGNLTHKTPDGSHRHPIRYVKDILQLPDGKMVIATSFGIRLINDQTGETSMLDYLPEGEHDVNRYVHTLYLNDNRELWIGTDGGGIYIYDLTTRHCRHLTTKDGLTSNFVNSISKDALGRILIATEHGLAFVAPRHPERVIGVNYCYGVDREYTSRSVVHLLNGNIMFGSTTGAVVIDPRHVQEINYTATLKLLAVSSDNDDDPLTAERMHRMLGQRELRLSYGQRTFELFFESINLRNQADIVYQYQVDGGEWSQPTGQQSVRFSSMEPGGHSMTLRAVSRTCGAVLDEVELTIHIGQPWWNTWWMWMGYVFLIALAFYGAWRVYQLHSRYMRLVVSSTKLSTATMQPVEQATADVPDDEEGRSFIDRVTKLTIDHITDADFNIDRLCREMAMSRTLFYVKLKSYTGKSPQDFIRVIRLERAAALLRSGRSVAEAAALSGFDNPKYFSTVFKKYFDVSPSKYQ